MFVCYDKDGDTPGRINMVSMGPSQETYGGKLTEFGYTWLYMPDTKVDILTEYVDLTKLKVKKRPSMGVYESGKFIRKVPKGCRVIVKHGTIIMASEIVNDGKIEFVPDHPGVYQLTFNCWPYITCTMEVTR
jgi:hypothetical protein